MYILDLKWEKGLWQIVFSKNCYSNHIRDLIPQALLESYHSPSGGGVYFLSLLTRAGLCYCLNN